MVTITFNGGPRFEGIGKADAGKILAKALFNGAPAARIHNSGK